MASSTLQIYYQTRVRELDIKIDKLAKFVLEECDGYPNKNEDVFDTVIRIIRDQKKELETKYKHNFTND